MHLCTFCNRHTINGRYDDDDDGDEDWQAGYNWMHSGALSQYSQQSREVMWSNLNEEKMSHMAAFMTHSEAAGEGTTTECQPGLH